jgi:hypothetical protein
MIWQSLGAGLVLEGKLEHSLAILTILFVNVGTTTQVVATPTQRGFGKQDLRGNS